MTPIIAGSICGGLLALAWSIGLIVYLIKRRKRKERDAKVAAGAALPKKKDPEQKFIIPPDPAIVLGHRLPGESAFKDEKHPPGFAQVHHANTLPEPFGEHRRESESPEPAPGSRSARVASAPSTLPTINDVSSTPGPSDHIAEEMVVPKVPSERHPPTSSGL